MSPAPDLLREAAYVDGAWVPVGAGPALEVSDPATGAVLGEQAGLPPGVFNVVTGEAATVAAELTGHPRVRKLLHRLHRGRRLLAACAGTVVSLELGGNAPFIVFDDADLDAAVAKVERHIRDAVARGARIACGGGRHALGGHFSSPRCWPTPRRTWGCAGKKPSARWPR